MADNKPALFPITAFIVSYHYARSAGLCVSRDTVYDLFIAAPTPDTQMNAAYVAFCPPSPRSPRSNPPSTHLRANPIHVLFWKKI